MTLVLCERDGPIALLTLNRPDQLNALSSALEEELAAAIASAQVREASVLIIRGAGERAFSAGADTTELDVATPESALAYYEYTGDVYEQLARLAVPSIAQIHGWCVGGGLELALACDLRVADASSRFWFPEVERGILPSSGGTARAVRALGPGGRPAPDPAGREDRRAARRSRWASSTRSCPTARRARRRWPGRRRWPRARAARCRSRARPSTPPPTARTRRRWRPSASATRRSPGWSEPLARRGRGRRRHRRHRRGRFLRAPRPAGHAVRGAPGWRRRPRGATRGS